MRSTQLLLWSFLSVLTVIRPAVAATGTLTGYSRSMNPAVSINGLFRGTVSDEQKEADYNGFRLDGIEARFTSVVDPFWRADVMIGIHPTHGEADDHDAHATDYVFDLHQAVLESETSPWGFGLTLGKFALPFGKHAPLHKHQYPFADAPLAVSTFLGEHVLTDTGILVAHQLPLPWYSDVQAYGVDGRAELFDAEKRSLAFGSRWGNLFDLTENATFELGGSILQGPAVAHAGQWADVQVQGVDLTWKWISAARRAGPAVTLAGEVLWPDYDEPDADPRGWFGLAQYRIQRNWWIGVGMGQIDMHGGMVYEEIEEHEEHDHTPRIDRNEYKLNLTFVPSEYSFVRLEADYYTIPEHEETDLRLVLQANFTIGSHPAHSY